MAVLNNPVNVLARFRAEVAYAEARIAETTGSGQAMYIEGRDRSQAIHDALSELMVAAADFLHCESCAYDAIAMVAPRNRLRAALDRVGGAK
ncbi:hypothetical protein [Pseudoxanthomonas mexicana]